MTMMNFRKTPYADAEHHLQQGRPNVYQQRSATLNHNGSGQYPPNEGWHRQSSVELSTQHQGATTLFNT